MALKIVYVGAGHSDSDPGAVSADGVLREEQLAEQLRDSIAANLIARNVPVNTDGTRGINQPLRNSIAIAKTCDGPRIEIHFNAGPPTARGVECLSLEAHKPLAQKLCRAISRHTQSPLRGQIGWKPDSAGQHHRLAFCREANGLILEVEFISNQLAMATYLASREKIAASLAEVLADAAGATNPLPPQV